MYRSQRSYENPFEGKVYIIRRKIHDIFVAMPNGMVWAKVQVTRKVEQQVTARVTHPTPVCHFLFILW